MKHKITNGILSNCASSKGQVYNILKNGNLFAKNVALFLLLERRKD